MLHYDSGGSGDEGDAGACAVGVAVVIVIVVVVVDVVMLIVAAAVAVFVVAVCWVVMALPCPEVRWVCSKSPTIISAGAICLTEATCRRRASPTPRTHTRTTCGPAEWCFAAEWRFAPLTITVPSDVGCFSKVITVF